jgi:hypothetical protein
MTPSAIAPYSRAETATAASWLPYVSDAIDAGSDPVASILEAVDKLYRRGLITEAVAALLCEIYDVSPVQSLELA